MSSFCIYCGVDGDDDVDNCLKVVLEEEEEEEVFDEINELPQVSLKKRFLRERNVGVKIFQSSLVMI